jgi:hypothetical protein
MGVKHHLLRLARIGAHEQHAAMAKPHVGDLHDHRHFSHAWPTASHSGVAHRSRRHSRARSGPQRAGSASDASEQVWPHCLPAVRRAQLSINQLGSWLDVTLVLERGLPRPQHLADRVPGHPRSRAISLIVLPLTKCSRRIRATVSTTNIPRPPAPNQSGKRIRPTCRGQFWTPIPRLRGSILHAE